MFMEKKTIHGKCSGIPAHVLNHFRKQRQSGASIQAYCKRSGISTWTFYNWRKLYKEPPLASLVKRLEPRISFSTLGPFSTSTGLCDIRFPSGITITVHRDTSSETLVPIIRALSEREAAC
jgi:hypothetical protein